MNDIDERLTDRLVAALGIVFVAAGATMLLGYTLLFAWCISLVLTLCLCIGALRSGGLGPFKFVFTAALACWLVSFTLMHGLDISARALYAGFPPATAASVFLLWLSPLLLVTIPYALWFRQHVMPESDATAVNDFRRRQDS